MLCPQISNVVYTFCIFSKVWHKFQNIRKNFIHPLYRKKVTFLANSDAVATITQPTTFLLSTYTAGFISDNKILPLLKARYTILWTRRLKLPRHDCTVRVQLFSSVLQSDDYRRTSTVLFGPQSYLTDKRTEHIQNSCHLQKA